MNYSYTANIEELSLFSAFEHIYSQREWWWRDILIKLRGPMNMNPGILTLYFRNIATVWTCKHCYQDLIQKYTRVTFHLGIHTNVRKPAFSFH